MPEKAVLGGQNLDDQQRRFAEDLLRRCPARVTMTSGRGSASAKPGRAVPRRQQIPPSGNANANSRLSRFLSPHDRSRPHCVPPTLSPHSRNPRGSWCTDPLPPERKCWWPSTAFYNPPCLTQRAPRRASRLRNRGPTGTRSHRRSGRPGPAVPPRGTVPEWSWRNPVRG